VPLAVWQVPQARAAAAAAGRTLAQRRAATPVSEAWAGWVDKQAPRLRARAARKLAAVPVAVLRVRAAGERAGRLPVQAAAELVARLPVQAAAEPVARLLVRAAAEPVARLLVRAAAEPVARPPAAAELAGAALAARPAQAKPVPVVLAVRLRVAWPTGPAAVRAIPARRRLNRT